VCADGAFEGEHCDDTISGGPSLHLFETGPDGNTYEVDHILIASGTATTQEAGQGDSGGPVFRPISGQPYIVGTITGGASTLVACTNWAPNWLNPARQCSASYYFTDIVGALSKWGLSLN